MSQDLGFRVQPIGGNDLFVPARATEHSAGLDVRAMLDNDLWIHPGERAVVSLGFRGALPPGHVGLLFIRSGHAKKIGLGLANGVGVIDADYREPYGAILVNNDPHNPIKIEPGERIGQVIIMKFEALPVSVVPHLESTGRIGGYGSTGTG